MVSFKDNSSIDISGEFKDFIGNFIESDQDITDFGGLDDRIIKTFSDATTIYRDHVFVQPFDFLKKVEKLAIHDSKKKEIYELIIKTIFGSASDNKERHEIDNFISNRFQQEQKIDELAKELNHVTQVLSLIPNEHRNIHVIKGCTAIFANIPKDQSVEDIFKELRKISPDKLPELIANAQKLIKQGDSASDRASLLTALTKLRGGFANGGDTCFIATALQCLNLLSDLLPKDVDLELKQKTDESIDDFAKRKHLAKAVLKLLDKSNQQGPQEPIDGSETVKLRDLLHNFSKGNIQSGKAGDANEVLRNLFEIFNLPSHQKSNIAKSRWTVGGSIASAECLETWKDKHTMQPGGICKTHFDIRGTGMDSNQLPSFFCLQFYGDKKDIEVEIPKALVFSSFDELKYYLVGCSIGGGGHAYAYVKENDRWIEYNDGHVGVVDTFEAENDMKHNRTAFIFKTRA